MHIYIGADHRGFELKESLKKFLTEGDYQVVDLGNVNYDANDDYPDFAKLVAQKISNNPEDRGILICRSGAGVDIVANKFKGVRSALVTDVKQAELVRYDDDTNVLSLASELTNEEAAKKIVDVWLKTQFSDLEKDKRRIEKIEKK
ncbi:MAG: RpiB/LacA/LacB family sugar-phosphate isomerase [Patescibacteria group bacterium]